MSSQNVLQSRFFDYSFLTPTYVICSEDCDCYSQLTLRALLKSYLLLSTVNPASTTLLFAYQVLSEELLECRDQICILTSRLPKLNIHDSGLLCSRVEAGRDLWKVVTETRPAYFPLADNHVLYASYI